MRPPGIKDIAYLIVIVVNLYQLDPQFRKIDSKVNDQEGDSESCSDDAREWYKSAREVRRTIVSEGTWQASAEFKEDNKYVQNM